MVVLGIDPGFSVTGFGIIKKEGTHAQLIDYGFLKLPSSQPLAQRIGIFHSFFDEKCKQFAVAHIALETPFLGKNTQTFLKLGYLRGILYLLSDRYQTGLHEFAPREVKLAVTGYGAAEKEQVARVVMRFFPALQAQEKADVTDAIAVALCGLWNQKQQTSVTAQFIARL